MDRPGPKMRTNAARQTEKERKERDQKRAKERNRLYAHYQMGKNVVYDVLSASQELKQD